MECVSPSRITRRYTHTHRENIRMEHVPKRDKKKRYRLSKTIIWMKLHRNTFSVNVALDFHCQYQMVYRWCGCRNRIKWKLTINLMAINMRLVYNIKTRCLLSSTQLDVRFYFIFFVVLFFILFCFAVTLCTKTTQQPTNIQTVRIESNTRRRRRKK